MRFSAFRYNNELLPADPASEQENDESERRRLQIHP
jgi:hypothetical protein